MVCAHRANTKMVFVIRHVGADTLTASIIIIRGIPSEAT